MTGADPSGGGERLDSWKAIAAYLGRDAGTVRRWERTRGLPVHRVPGGKGSSVFAYTYEIDAWLKSAPQEMAAQEAMRSEHDVAVRNDTWWRWAVASLAIAVIVLLGWRMQRTSASVSDLRVSITPEGVTARAADGRQLWVHRFGSEWRHYLSEVGERVRVIGGASPAVYYTTSNRLRRADDSGETGEFTSLTLDGRVRWTFTFDDTLTIGGKPYGPPWAVTAFAVHDAGARRQLAVAAHHWTWSASLVAVVDDDGKRRGTFVNDGWLEQLQWVAPDRLVVGGFSQSRDGGLALLIDTAQLDGQSPESDPRHRCGNCGAGRPLRMAVMPRTEINLLTHSRFNRAILERTGDRLIVRTVEVPHQGQGVADAIYEFTASLDLVRASFSQRYWEVHDQLEAEKKIDHNRAQCPDSKGPRLIHLWSPGTGWRTVSPSAARRIDAQG